MNTFLCQAANRFVQFTSEGNLFLYLTVFFPVILWGWLIVTEMLGCVTFGELDYYLFLLKF